jgi:hypothetical protein
MKNKDEEGAALGYRMVTLAYGYYSHTAAVDVAFDRRVIKFIEDSNILSEDAVGIVPRKSGKGHEYSKLSWLKHDDFNTNLTSEIDRLWLSGVLIIIGDQLERHHYFDRSPGLEFIRHLRHAVARNNRFKIDNPHKLKQYPAHNKNGKFRGCNQDTCYEITPEINNSVLMWEFMAPGDIMDAILSAGFYLIDKYGVIN